MQNRNLQIAFISGAAAVALGAFGAHALKTLLDEQQLHTYQIAVQYHFYHSIALAIAGLLQFHFSNKWAGYAGKLFTTGLVLFSGSLYLMSFLNAAGVEDVKWLGAITPLGGVSFIAGWLCLFLSAKKTKQ
jgi:uncharacterized membrane protein YgdD (TMEM256/DUF423 family)